MRHPRCLTLTLSQRRFSRDTVLRNPMSELDDLQHVSVGIAPGKTHGHEQVTRAGDRATRRDARSRSAESWTPERQPGTRCRGASAIAVRSRVLRVET